MFFFPLLPTAVAPNEMTVSSLSLCCLCSLLSSLILPSPFLSVSLSHLSVLHLWGQSNERRPCSDWMMYDVIRWDESMCSSKDNEKGKGRETEEKCRTRDTEMLLTSSFERERMEGECCRCLHVTMGVGHSFTDASTLAHFLREIVLQISSVHPLSLSCFLCHTEENRRIAQCPGSLPGGRAWGHGWRLAEGGLPWLPLSPPETVMNCTFIHGSYPLLKLHGRRPSVHCTD